MYTQRAKGCHGCLVIEIFRRPQWRKINNKNYQEQRREEEKGSVEGVSAELMTTLQGAHIMEKE